MGIVVAVVVQVQMLKYRPYSNAGAGSDQITMLRAGESYYSKYSGFAVVVCSTGCRAHVPPR